MTDDFFSNAPENYEVPKNDSAYMKFEQGENKFRILEKPIFGWEAWEPGTDGKDKPVRFKMDARPTDASPFRNGRINHFWAMPVWNFKNKRVEILQITQKTILASIENLARNEEWGSPLTYSIAVTKKGTTKEDTEYQVAPMPHKPVPEDVADAFKEIKAKGFNMNELYKGGDPFKPSTTDTTVSAVDEYEDVAQPND
jgi:hypothetical protein